MAIDYDPNDPNPRSWQSLTSTQGCVSGPIWAPLTLYSSRANLSKRSPERFVRAGTYDVQDLIAYDVGSLAITTEVNTSQETVGDLYVEYDITFSTPQINSTNQAQLLTQVKLPVNLYKTSSTALKQSAKPIGTKDKYIKSEAPHQIYLSNLDPERSYRLTFSTPEHELPEALGDFISDTFTSWVHHSSVDGENIHTEGYYSIAQPRTALAKIAGKLILEFFGSSSKYFDFSNIPYLGSFSNDIMANFDYDIQLEQLPFNYLPWESS